MVEHKAIINVAIQILNQFEMIHDSGYVFNDLKPENIMLMQPPNQKKEENFEDGNLVLVDFGFATRHHTNDGQHVSKG